MAIKEPVGDTMVRPPTDRDGPLPARQGDLRRRRRPGARVPRSGAPSTPTAWPTATGEVLAWLTDDRSAGSSSWSARRSCSSRPTSPSTRYGNIKLGPDDSEPEFSTFSWVSMMFATGMGIGLMFWGVAEPLTYLNAAAAASGLARARARRRRAQLGDGVHLLPLGLPPLVDVRRDRPGHRLLRLPQGRRQPGLRRVPAAPRRPRRRRGRARRSTSSRSSPRCSARPPRSASAPCRSPAASTTSSAAASRKWLTVAVIAVLTLCFVRLRGHRRREGRPVPLQRQRGRRRCCWSSSSSSSGRRCSS